MCLRLLFIGDIELLKTHILEAQNTSETKNETIFHTSVTFLMHETSCPSDLDGDGAIGVTDLLMLLGQYGIDYDN